MKFLANKEILSYDPTTKSLSPDHIVYCKAKQLIVPGDADGDKIQELFEAFTAENGYKPKIAFVEGLGMFTCGMTMKEAVNYTGFFLCTKCASRVMKLQHKYAPEYTMDIVEINSKSGLVGSNKNFAYAGSKFGSVGLVQSFALELCPYNIKVNGICPGNFLDGPLWSDPVRGLFVQYLNAGKVPGAKNVEDVRRFYESKVPMNRGCMPADVARAVMYCVEQKYETGQAIPVTGGQVVLN